MSMYNLVFGQNQYADFILATLGLTRFDVGRFRDAFVADGQIAIYTRNGGGNRESYQGTFDELSKHPLYLSDRDDDFDCTYATIYFSFPDQWKEELAAISSGIFDPSERWQNKIASISEGEITPAMKQFAEKLFKKLESGQGGVIEV